MNTFEINLKNGKSQQRNKKSQKRNRRHKEEPNGPFRTEKYINIILKNFTAGLNSIMKGTDGRIMQLEARMIEITQEARTIEITQSE